MKKYLVQCPQVMKNKELLNWCRRRLAREWKDTNIWTLQKVIRILEEENANSK